jgi:hypothetical protein
MSEDQSVLLDERNVHFFDGSTGDMLGGLFQNGSVTQGNFISMLNIVLVPHPLIKPRTFMVKARSRQTLSLTNQRLTPGDYDIYAPDGCRCIDSRSKERKTQLTWIGSIKLSDEPVVRRLPPYRVGGRETDFDRGVRARDGKCVVTGTVNLAAHVDDWTSFEAAHIFPVEKESYWIEHNFSRWITNTDPGNHSAPIDSIQNGFLLLAHIHQLFDTYAISVNPDVSDFLTYGICNKDPLLIYPKDNYKIVSFIADSFEVDGRTLDPVCQDPANPNRVSDHLRWHFRQSVLKNMRKAREPSFEHDFPPGTDMIKEILEGPFPAERLEMELSYRLRGWKGAEGSRDVPV